MPNHIRSCLPPFSGQTLCVEKVAVKRAWRRRVRPRVLICRVSTALQRCP